MTGALDLTVRRMTEADLDDVHAIDQQSFSAPWSRRSYENELTAKRLSRCWVAEAGGRVVGSIVAWLIVDELHIITISVHPDNRRKGIGRRLLQTAMDEAIEQGAISATLEVRVSNHSAQALYRAFGFKIVGRRMNYYADNGEDALLMTWYKHPMFQA